MKTNVSVGLSTIVGYAFSALSGALAGYAAIENVPGTAKWLGILSLAAVAATNFNRSMQAKAAIEAAPAPSPEVLSDRPETAVSPDAPAPTAV
jgi:hypothetical protein